LATIIPGQRRCPIPSSSINKDTVNAFKLNFITSANIKGIYNVTLLNALLKVQGKPPVVAH